MVDVAKSNDGNWYAHKPGAGWIEVDQDTARGLTAGSVEAFTKAFGAEVENVYQGGRQLLNQPGARERRQEIRQEMQPYVEGSPWATTLGTAAPSVVTGGGGAAARLGFRGLAALEGTYGAASMADDPLLGAALGGAGGAAGGILLGNGFRSGVEMGEAVVNRSRQAVDAGISGPPGSITGAQPTDLAQAAQRGFTGRISRVFDGNAEPLDAASQQMAQRLDYRLTPADLAQSVGRKNFESMLKTGPAGEAAFARHFGEHNQTQVNRRAAMAAGMGDKDKVTQSMLGQNADDIAQGYRDLAGEVGEAQLDKASMGAEVSKDLLPEDAERMSKIIDNIPDEVTGKQGFEYVSRLRKQSGDLWRKGEGLMAEALDDLSEMVEERMMDAAARAGNKNVLQKLDDLRMRWKAQRLLERRGVVTEEGDVNATALRSGFLSSKFLKTQYGRNRSMGSQGMDDLADIARLTGISRERIGNSGTATRMQDAMNPATYLKGAVAEGYLGNYGRAAGQAATGLGVGGALTGGTASLLGE